MDINKLEKTVSISRILMFSIVIVTLASYLGWFYLIQKQSVSADTQVWGAFGDFIGGILNPIIAFSAFYWLTVSVLVQKKELEETRKALIDSSKAQQDLVNAQAESLKVQQALADAQERTVWEMSRSSKIEAVQISMSVVTTQIEAQVAYLNILRDKAMSSMGMETIKGQDGDSTYEVEIGKAYELLVALETKREEYIKIVNSLAEHRINIDKEP